MELKKPMKKQQKFRFTVCFHQLPPSYGQLVSCPLKLVSCPLMLATWPLKLESYPLKPQSYPLHARELSSKARELSSIARELSLQHKQKKCSNLALSQQKRSIILNNISKKPLNPPRTDSS